MPRGRPRYGRPPRTQASRVQGLRPSGAGGDWERRPGDAAVGLNDPSPYHRNAEPLARRQSYPAAPPRNARPPARLIEKAMIVVEPEARRVRPGGLQSPSGRVAQWESARFTRERPLVRTQPRPLKTLQSGFAEELSSNYSPACGPEARRTRAPPNKSAIPANTRAISPRPVKGRLPPVVPVVPSVELVLGEPSS